MPLLNSPLQKNCFQAARRIAGVPDAVNDEEAKASINPAILEMVIQIVMDLLQNCPQSSQAFARLQSFVAAKGIDRVVLPDNIRLNWVINRWMSRLGVPRTAGDVSQIKEALASTIGGVQKEEFDKIQTEVMFLGI